VIRDGHGIRPGGNPYLIIGCCRIAHVEPFDDRGRGRDRSIVHQPYRARDLQVLGCELLLGPVLDSHVIRIRLNPSARNQAAPVHVQEYPTAIGRRVRILECDLGRVRIPG